MSCDDGASDSVAADFVHCYREFDDYRHSNDGRYDETKPCYFLFGLSGVGKSALISRLRSTKDPTDFYQNVVQNKADVVEECGIKVANGVEGTLIPKVYQMGDFQICDMPGFKDLLEGKQIIVTILQKCLVTMVKNAGSYIIVFNASEFMDDHGTTVCEYYTEFLKLFGNHIEHYMRRMYFVITQIDKLPEENQSCAALLKRIKRLGLSSAQSTIRGLHSFVNRLYNTHCIIDYRTQTQEDIAGLLYAMMNKATPDVALNRELIGTDYQALNVGEDALNSRCVKRLGQIEERVDALMANVEALSTANQTSVDLDARLAEQSRMLVNISAELAAANESKARIIGDIERKATVVDSLAKNVHDVQAEVDGLKQQEANLDKRGDGVGAFECVHRIALLSSKSDNAHVVKALVSVPRIDDCVLLVFKYEHNDELLKRLLGNNGRVVPAAMKQLHTLRLSDGILHSSKYRHDCATNVEVLCDEVAGRGLKIKVKYSEAFKVFVFYPVATTAESIKQFTKGACEHALVGVQKQLRSVQAEQSDAQRQLEQLKNSLECASSNISSLADDAAQATRRLSKLHNDVRVAAAAAEQSVQERTDALATILQDKGLDLIKKVHDIFQANKLRTPLTPQLDEFARKVAAVEEALKNRLLAIQSTRDRRHKEIEALIPNNIVVDNNNNNNSNTSGTLSSGTSNDGPALLPRHSLSQEGTRSSMMAHRPSTMRTPSARSTTAVAPSEASAMVDSMQRCKWCGTVAPADHERKCASRIVMCKKCSSTIKIKDKEEHAKLSGVEEALKNRLLAIQSTRDRRRKDIEALIPNHAEGVSP